ncbi:c-type cytochrome [Pseudooceanicola algae]|uniref:Cytochrome c domain-containing protein n=1 Tax=Pseudooceanicola algae TaxID=1537215 RepID=A0A418SD62_9RHOB|nr:c-type cytochrome [Pseudooceanicola algae]QPM92316.1 hypothetical protein PSAL_035800 [Pseudooceanicola algae]
MRTVFLTLAVLAGLGLAGAGAVVGLGLYNVSAQAGHLPGVSRVLHTTFRNAVRLRAPSMDQVPPLDDPDLIALGAGHYATACAGCHATPDEARSATIRAMLPAPPPIEEAIAHWQPNELHWIIENGVKMSGMPAWPVKHRGDEVWSVVAYLTALKTGAAPEVPSRDLTGAAYCASCHTQVGGPVPRLDIQSLDYLAAKLEDYRSGTRPSGIMAQAARLVPPQDDRALLTELAAGTPQPTPRPTPTGPGAELARQGTRDVPACLACHGKDPSRGPALFGQPEAYLADQLRLWAAGTYHHDPLMLAAARELSEDDIIALSRYFSGGGD